MARPVVVVVVDVASRVDATWLVAGRHADDEWRAADVVHPRRETEHLARAGAAQAAFLDEAGVLGRRDMLDFHGIFEDITVHGQVSQRAGARWVYPRDLVAVVVRLFDFAAVVAVGAWPGLGLGFRVGVRVGVRVGARVGARVGFRVRVGVRV